MALALRGESQRPPRGRGGRHGCPWRRFNSGGIADSTGSGPRGARETPVAKPSSPRDELELSAAGKMLDQLGQTPNVRQERIAQIKEAIANGTYDTDEKLKPR